jgi:hypothetical protein
MTSYQLKSALGQTFGWWTVIEERKEWKKLRKCRCECGTIKMIDAHQLRSGHTKSCGCKFVHSMHGMHTTNTYDIWVGAKQRCTNKNAKAYFRYGGRGIKMCKRWMDSFSNFYADMGDCPKGFSIERIDVSGDYEPGNCKWIPLGMQGRNKRNNVRITHNGETMIMSDWAARLGMKLGDLQYRITRRHRTIEDVMREKQIAA